MDLNCDPTSSTPKSRLLSSKCILGWRVRVPDQAHVDGGRDLNLVLKARRSECGLYVPHRREDEPVILRGASVVGAHLVADSDIADPDAERVVRHVPLHPRVRVGRVQSQGLEVRVGDAENENQRRKKLLRTKKRGTSNSLHINPDLREEEDNGSSATGQEIPIYDEAAISNHSNAQQNAEPISSRKAAVMPSPSNAVALTPPTGDGWICIDQMLQQGVRKLSAQIWPLTKMAALQTPSSNAPILQLWLVFAGTLLEGSLMGLLNLSRRNQLN